jgi:hypothetical protein
MTLIDQLNLYKNCTIARSGVNQYGLPEVRSLILCTIQNDGSCLYEEITPSPLIIQRSPATEAIENTNIQGANINYEVKGVSGIYTREQIENSLVTYFIDATFVNATTITGGFRCKLVSTTQKATSWDLTLVYESGRQDYKVF